MFYYNMFVELVFKIIFFVILLPFKIIDVIIRWCIAAKLFLSDTNRAIKYAQMKHDGTLTNHIEKEFFLSAYDYKHQAYWRKYRLHKLHRYILSLIVWIFLIVRFSIH